MGVSTQSTWGVEKSGKRSIRVFQKNFLS